MPRKHKHIGGIIGADPLPSGSPRPGVSNLAELGADNAFEAPSLDLKFDGQLSSFTRATTSPTAPKANGDQLATGIVAQNKTGNVQSKYMGPDGKLVSGYVENNSPSRNPDNTSFVGAGGVTSPTKTTGFTAPDGSNTAVKFTTVAPATYYGRDTTTNVSFTQGKNYTLSAYFKVLSGSVSVGVLLDSKAFGGNTATWERAQYLISPGGGAPTLDTSTRSGSGDYGIQDVGDGWYRIWVSAQADFTARFTSPLSTNGSQVFRVQLTDVGDEVLVWGLQFEEDVRVPSQFIDATSDQVPRVEYAASGNPLGLLVEEARTNLLTQSSDMTHSDWSRNQSLNVTGGQADPAGGTDAVTLNDNNASGAGALQQDVATGTAGTTYTGSIWVKRTASAASEFRLRIKGAGESNSNCVVDTLNGVVTGTYAKIEEINSDWMRVSVSTTLVGNVDVQLFVFPAHSGSYGGAYDVSATGSHIVYGPQIEEGEAATSYIPTGSTSLTRTADDITLATSAFGFDIDNSTVLVDATLQSETATGLYPRIWELSGSSTQRLFYRVFGGNAELVFDDSGNDTLTIDTVSSYPYAAKFASAHIFSGGSTVASTALNGVVTSQSVTSTGTGSYTQLSLGGPTSATPNYQTTNRSNGHIRRFTYFPRAISDASLATYTGANPPTIDLDKPTRRWGGMTGRSLVESVAGAPVIDHSLRFDGSGDYLEWTPTVARGSSWTFSVWFKRASTGTSTVWHPILEADSGANSDTISIYNDALYIGHASGTSSATIADSFADTEWHHLVVSWASGQSTVGDALKIYLDGNPKTISGTISGSAIATNTVFNFGSNVQNVIGGRSSGTAFWFDGQLAEIHFIDGQALPASDFGETRNGQWVPKEVTGVTYGTNGFYLPFDRKPEGVTLLLDGSSTTDVTGLSTVTPSASGYSTNQTSGAKFNQYIDFQNSGYFNVTPPSSLGASNEPFTIETWVWFDALDNEGVFQISTTAVGASTSIGGGVSLAIGTVNNKWRIYNETTNVDNINSPDTGGNIATTKWYHVALTSDGTTLRWFVDGSEIHSIAIASTSVAAGGYGHLFIGGYFRYLYVMEGRIEGFRVTKGIARDIASGFSNGTPISGGGWDVALTNDIQYGSLGRDATTNSNDFTVPANTLTPDDQLIDTPNLRFATLDPDNLYHETGTGTLAEASLKFTAPSVSYQGSAMSTLGKSSGKWYCEILASGTDPGIGLYDGDFSANDLSYENYGGQPNQRIAVNGPGRLFALGTQNRYRWKYPNPVPANGNGNQYEANSACSPSSYTHSGWTSGTTVIGMAIDLDAGELEVFFDGVSQGVAFDDLNLSSRSSGDPWHIGVCDWKTSESSASIFTLNFGQDHTFAGSKSPLTSPYTDDDGNGEFYYEPPPGFKVLATTVVASSDTTPTTGVLTLAEHYQTKL